MINEGRIETQDGKIDEDHANKMLEMQRDPSFPARRKFGELSTKDAKEVHAMYAKARLKNEIERGKLLEAKVKNEIGQLISVEAVKNAMFAKGRIIRDGILNVPDRVSALLATIDDASKIHAILMKELRDVLTELSRDDK
ncbi:MAG: hypothetical protein LBH92_00555 [Bacteroidales bacterium]|nr:hypothetical protein [Bacteroidales bacterium]